MYVGVYMHVFSPICADNLYKQQIFWKPFYKIFKRLMHVLLGKLVYKDEQNNSIK